MSLFYEMTLPIDSRDVDGNGYCKASALLGHIQEAATQAAEHGGFGRAMTTDGYHAFWMLTRVWYQLRRPLRWEEPLTIRTWHREDKGATMYRDYDLFVDGEAVGECVSAWVLASMDTRQIIRLATVHELDGTGGGELCKSKKLSKLRLPGPGAGRAAEAALQRHRPERPREQHPVRRLRLRRPGDGAPGPRPVPVLHADRLSGRVPPRRGAASLDKGAGRDPLRPGDGRRRQIPL